MGAAADWVRVDTGAGQLEAGCSSSGEDTIMNLFRDRFKVVSSPTFDWDNLLNLFIYNLFNM